MAKDSARKRERRYNKAETMQQVRDASRRRKNAGAGGGLAAADFFDEEVDWTDWEQPQRRKQKRQRRYQQQQQEEVAVAVVAAPLPEQSPLLLNQVVVNHSPVTKNVEQGSKFRVFCSGRRPGSVAILLLPVVIISLLLHFFYKVYRTVASAHP